jgi:hypothetical protein
VRSKRGCASFVCLGDVDNLSIPFVVVTHGYLGGQAMQYIRELAHVNNVALASGDVPRGKFLASAFQEISVTLCKGNGRVVALVSSDKWE